MIDIHSHIIPNIDDGSKDIDMTIKMLENAYNDGTSHIIATPHYCFNYGDTVISDVKKYVEKLNELVRRNNIDIEIYAGQEVFLYGGTIEDYESGKIGTINKSRYMLVEFDFMKINQSIYDILYELSIRGVVPIIAHAERYKDIIEDNSVIDKLSSNGCLFQLNSGSIEGKFGKKIKKTAERLLDNNIYSFIGSDAHSCGIRCTGLSKALDICKERNPEVIEMFEVNGRKLLNDEDIIFTGQKMKKEKRGIFKFFNK